MLSVRLGLVYLRSPFDAMTKAPPSAHVPAADPWRTLQPQHQRNDQCHREHAERERSKLGGPVRPPWTENEQSQQEGCCDCDAYDYQSIGLRHDNHPISTESGTPW